MCSSLELQNDPIGSYGQLFHRMSERISDQKMNRYKAADIIKLNHKTIEDYTRECAVCKRIGRVNENGICPSCAGIMKLSGVKRRLIRAYSSPIPMVIGCSADMERWNAI